MTGSNDLADDHPARVAGHGVRAGVQPPPTRLPRHQVPSRPCSASSMAWPATTAERPPSRPRSPSPTAASPDVSQQSTVPAARPSSHRAIIPSFDKLSCRSQLVANPELRRHLHRRRHLRPFSSNLSQTQTAAGQGSAASPPHITTSAARSSPQRTTTTVVDRY